MTERTEHCRACGGIGERPAFGGGYETCRVCKGTGYADEFATQRRDMTNPVDAEADDDRRRIAVLQVLKDCGRLDCTADVMAEFERLEEGGSNDR